MKHLLHLIFPAVKSTGLFFTMTFCFVAPDLLAQNNMLDTSFDTDGWNTAAMTAGNDYGFASVLQPDGKVVIGGSAGTSFGLIRYNTNGTPDNSFGTNGMAFTTIGAGSGASAIAIQPDGKLIAAGYSFGGADTDFAMARYNTDGSLDPGFGTGGMVSTPFGTGMDLARSVVVQPDGKIILAGEDRPNNTKVWALMRYNANGTLDTSFGTGGKATVAMGTTGTNQLNSIELQSDGKILATGSGTSTTSGAVTLARLNTDGSPDNSFNGNGMVVINGVNNDDAGVDIIVQPDGKIVIGSQMRYTASGHDEFTLHRFNADGTADSGFGTGGAVHTHIGLEHSRMASVTRTADGKLLAGGYSFSTSGMDFTLARYNADGSLDTGWGNNGTVQTNINGHDIAYTLLVQPDGKIVATGTTGVGTSADYAIARYLSSGSVGILDFTASENALFIYPNPIEQSATLDYTLTSKETLSISLIDMTGRTVQSYVQSRHQEPGTYSQQITIPDGIASGTYAVVLATPTSKASVQVVVK